MDKNVIDLDFEEIDFKFKSFKVLPCKDDGENVNRCSPEEADFWGIYVTRPDDTQYWILDFKSQYQALKFVKFILSICENYNKKD